MKTGLPSHIFGGGYLNSGHNQDTSIDNNTFKQPRHLTTVFTPGKGIVLTKDPLLVKAQLGKGRRNVDILPPPDHVYGLSSDHHDNNRTVGTREGNTTSDRSEFSMLSDSLIIEVALIFIGFYIFSSRLEFISQSNNKWGRLC